MMGRWAPGVQGLTTWGQKAKRKEVSVKSKQAPERGSVPSCSLINYPSQGEEHRKEKGVPEI